MNATGSGTTESLNRYGKTEKGLTWHLIDRQGETRCGKTPTNNWDLREIIQYPDTERLCRQCLEPKSLTKEKQVMALRKQSLTSIETMPTISREWRAQAMTEPLRNTHPHESYSRFDQAHKDRT